MNAPVQLRDIHLPPEPSWWPPAPGWWLLALLVVLAVTWCVRHFWRKRRAQQRARALLAQFDQAASLVDHGERLAAVSALMRRAALLHDPASATLGGEAWLRFLDRDAADAGLAAGVFTRGVGRVLLDGPYMPAVDAARVQAVIGPARQRYLSLVRAR